MSKETILKTKRLIIRSMNDEETACLIEEEQDSGLKSAYREMLDGGKRDPDNRLWYVPWKIVLKNQPNEMIGSLCFKGKAVKGAVEIGYGLESVYEGNGYMTEAVRAAVDWAFSQENVYIIRAETAPDNAASQNILKKLDFKADGTGEEGPRFRLDKPSTAWMSIYMCFGLSIGLAIGSSTGSNGIGMCLGMGVGMLIGLVMDRAERKRRSDITGENADQQNSGRPKSI